MSINKCICDAKNQNRRGIRLQHFKPCNTAEYHDLIYINSILSIPEETTIDPKELRNNGYVKPFQQVSLDLDKV